MNICLVLIIFFSLPFLVNSTSNNVDVSKIARDSSLSLDDSNPYWLSPSGNIAFGFYQLPWSPNQYTVGIWFIKSPHKTLVWTANHKDLIPAVHKPSLIIFTMAGKLVLRTDNKDKLLLFDVAEPVSYAKLHDNGNFVLYGSDSQVVWESFDYPTDTLLGGQNLKLGVDRLISISGEYILSIRKRDNAVFIWNIYDRVHAEIYSKPFRRLATPATLNLDTTGELYLANSIGAVRKIVIYEGKNQPRKFQDASNNVDEEAYIYRATLGSRGDFTLFKERIDGNFGDDEDSSSSSIQLWASSTPGEQCVKVLGSFFIFGIPMLVLIAKVDALQLIFPRRRL